MSTNKKALIAIILSSLFILFGIVGLIVCKGFYADYDLADGMSLTITLSDVKPVAEESKIVDPIVKGLTAGGFKPIKVLTTYVDTDKDEITGIICYFDTLTAEQTTKLNTLTSGIVGIEKTSVEKTNNSLNRSLISKGCIALAILVVIEFVYFAVMYRKNNGWKIGVASTVSFVANILSFIGVVAGLGLIGIRAPASIISVGFAVSIITIISNLVIFTYVRDTDGMQPNVNLGSIITFILCLVGLVTAIVFACIGAIGLAIPLFVSMLIVCANQLFGVKVLFEKL